MLDRLGINTLIHGPTAVSDASRLQCVALFPTVCALEHEYGSQAAGAMIFTGLQVLVDSVTHSYSGQQVLYMHLALAHMAMGCVGDFDAGRRYDDTHATKVCLRGCIESWCQSRC